MEKPDAQSERDIVIRAMELNMLESDMGQVLSTCKENQAKLGKGLLCIKMAPTADGIPTFWKAVAEGIPNRRFAGIAAQADAGRGIVSVLLIYPERVAGYVLNFNTGPAWRAMTQRPFVIVEEHVLDVAEVAAIMQKARPPSRPLRPEDIEADPEDFL